MPVKIFIFIALQQLTTAGSLLLKFSMTSIFLAAKPYLDPSGAFEQIHVIKNHRSFRFEYVISFKGSITIPEKPLLRSLYTYPYTFILATFNRYSAEWRYRTHLLYTKNKNNNTIIIKR